MAKPYSYDEAGVLMSDVLTDLSILAGDLVGPSDASWQDVAGTCAVSLRQLASRLDQARMGNVIDGPVVFPSPSEILGND